MKIVAIMAAFNEERFIATSLEHWRSEGVDVYLIDNGSTDRTVEIAEAYRGKGLVGLEFLPRRGTFHLDRILERKEEIAMQCDADWLLHVDADEFHQARDPGQPLAEALAVADASGYNAVNFLELTFLPTREDPDHDRPDFQDTLRTYYAFLPSFPHRLNAWKRQPCRVNLRESAGHRVAFPGLRIYPVSLHMRHYIALSRQHAVVKYSNRSHPASALDKGWHTWRERPRPEFFAFPARGELRTWAPGAPLDTSSPRRKHYFELLTPPLAADPPPSPRHATALRRLNALLQPPVSLPSMQGWAIRPDAGLLLAERIVHLRPRVVVELGSGVSTILAGYALKHTGGGKVYSLDHDESHCQRSIRQVERHTLKEWVEVLHAPLVNTFIDGEAFRFYDLQELLSLLPGPIDFLVVDGPPGPTGPLARYPALPVLLPHLSFRAAIFLDDAYREDEMKIVASWGRKIPEFRTTGVPRTEQGVALLQRRKVSKLTRAARKGLTRFRTLVEIRRSGLFDADFYVRTYPDVAASRLPALLHYVLYGSPEGRMPGPLFNPKRYLSQNLDARISGLEPMVHFLRQTGRRDGNPGHESDAKTGTEAAQPAHQVGGHGATHRHTGEKRSKTKTPRELWVAHVERMARPVLAAFAAGELSERMPLERRDDCPPGRRAVARLEAVARLLAGIAPWLSVHGLPGPEENLRQELAGLALTGLSRGFDPRDRNYFGFDRHQQALVEAAFLAQALHRGRPLLWDPLEGRAKALAIEAFKVLRNRTPHFNNWLLFGAMPEAFLASVGASPDTERIDCALRRHEQWYLGDGVYGDGPHFHADYYNSFVIQPMQLDVLRLVSGQDPYAAGLLPVAESRLSRWAAIQERHIHIDGSWPVVGRSITYRVGAFHGLAQAALLELLPRDLPPPQVRCALTAACQRSLGAPGTYDEAGWLHIGLHGHQPALGEAYITTASQYLASLVFLPLGLPPSHPFWAGEDVPWTSLRVWANSENLLPDRALPD